MFENAVQREVFDALLAKIGATAAALYLDSCTLRQLGARLDSTRMLVAHALREVRASIEYRLGSESPPVTEKPGDLDVLRRLLNKLAHRRWLEIPEPIDEKFRTAAAKVDETLASLLNDLNVAEAPDAGLHFLAHMKRAGEAFAEASLRDHDVHVLQKFVDHIAPGPKAYYHDALRLLDDRFSFVVTRSYLIAHALREAESGLRDVLLPHEFHPDEMQEKAENTHLQEVHAILAAYGIPRFDAVAQAWESITTVAADSNLAVRAHVSEFHLELPRGLDHEAQGLFRSVIDVFAALLARFEHEFGKYLHLMDEILSSAIVQKKKFLSELPQTDAIYDYFFRRLDNPDWIAALADSNVLRHTPEPFRRGDRTEFPAWPQGDYLRRMLDRDRVLAPAISAILKLAAASANPRVHEEIARVASLLPPDLRREAAKCETTWIEKHSFTWFLHAEAASALARKLAESGQADAATDLLRVLVRFDVVSDDGGDEIMLCTDRLALEQIMKDDVPQLAAMCGTSILEIVGDALETLQRAKHPGLVSPIDYSYVWRTTIEAQEQNVRGDLRDELVDALRDGGTALVESDRSRLREVASCLLRRSWNIERRVALHIVACGDDSELAGELASRIDLLDSDDCWHEMSRILTAHWREIPEGARSAVTEFILNLAASATFDSGATRWRQFRHISRLPTPVPADLQLVARRLAAEFGTISDPDLLMKAPRAGFVAPHTPLSRDELARMEIGEIIAFLQRWQPRPTDYQTMTTDSPGALAEHLRAIVAMRPDEYADVARKFRDLPPVYVLAVVGGLADAAQHGAKFRWNELTDLLSWVIGQTRQVNDHRAVSDENTSRSWLFVRLAILDLLENAMRSRSLPTEGAEQIGDFLQELSRDPNPSAEDERDHPNDIERWFANAFGTVRGRLIRVLLVFAEWANSETARHTVIRTIDELLYQESSPGVYFMIGNVFVHLLRLDSEWSRSHVGRLFDGSAELATAAWAGYLQDGITTESVALLRSKYELAVAALDPRAEPSPVDKWLGQVLVLVYSHGDVGPEQDSLIQRFFERAPDALRYHSLWSAAAHIRANPSTDHSIIARLMALWEWRVEQCGSVSELRAFDSWFQSGVFPIEWALDQLARAGERGVRFSGFMMLVNDDLANLWPNNAARLMVATRAITEAETDYMQLNAARQGLRRLVTQGSASDDLAIRGEARRIANIVAARGMTDFKDLA